MTQKREKDFTVALRSLRLSLYLLVIFQPPPQVLSLTSGGVEVEAGQLQVEAELLKGVAGDGENPAAETGLLESFLNRGLELLPQVDG